MTPGRPGALAGIIWDHDGTLVDSLRVVVAATNAVLAERGRPARPPAEIIAGMVAPTAPRMGGLVGTSDADERRQLAEDFYRHAHLVGEGLASAYAGIAAVVEACQQAGLAQGVLSNNQGALVRRLMRALALDRHMRFVWGEEDVAAPKPDPRGMAAAAAALGAEAGRCLAIGDGHGDVAAAHGAGLAIVGVTWGIHPRAEMDSMGFDRLVDTPAELGRLLIG
jgi:HAD superfamily hydrolase (TIGR01509 family)